MDDTISSAIVEGTEDHLVMPEVLGILLRLISSARVDVDGR